MDGYMREQLEKIFHQAFGVDKINMDMSIDNVEGWDSMAHVGLIMELQKEFKISISPADAIELTSVEKIIKYLKENAEQ
jgi:acyl carrier protein